MIRMILLSAFLYISACAAPQVQTYTDPEFIPYLLEFQADYSINVTNYPIQFAILPQPRIAQCGYPQILVDPSEWAKLSENIKKVTIYHELGHCVFHRDHDSAWIVDEMGYSVPRSIMHPTMNYQLGFKWNWQYYKDELIKNRGK